MKELVSAIPDPQVVLSLPPEELAGKLVFLLKERLANSQGTQREHFHIGNLVGEIQDLVNPPTYGTVGNQVAVPVVEAFAWLQGQALVVSSVHTTSPGWYMLSRRAWAMQSQGDFELYRAAAVLPRELLHPSIAERVWLSFVRGDYDTAVFQAMRRVEIELREATGIRQYGVALAASAFAVPSEEKGKVKAAGPLTDVDADKGEQEGMMQLFRGALGALKNPHSHRVVDFETPADAVATVLFASQLLRIIDRRVMQDGLGRPQN